MIRFLMPLFLGLGFAISPLQAQNSSTPSSGTAAPGDADVKKKDVIIVIRHAEDATSWASGSVSEKSQGEKNPDGTSSVNPFPSEYWQGQAPIWPMYNHDFTLINEKGEVEEFGTDGFQIAFHGLSGYWKTATGKDGTKMDKPASPKGESQARRLAAKLDGFLSSNGFSPITRVVTMDPRENGATPNPFCTLWPYLNSKAAIGLYLVKRTAGNDKSPGIMTLVNNEATYVPGPTHGVPSHGAFTTRSEKLLSHDGGSTVICWTGEGMRDSDGVLAKLCENYVGQVPEWAKANPERCSDVAVFYQIPDGDKQMGVVERWDFGSGSDIGEFEYVKGSTLPADAERAALKK